MLPKQPFTPALLILMALAVSIMAFRNPAASKKAPDWNASTGLSEIYAFIGAEYNQHGLEPRGLDSTQVERGQQIVLEGRAQTSPGGGRGKWVSKYYNCNSCHNMVFEEPHALNTDPEARLAYARKNDMPFLQGTMLYGAVSRLRWYNGDYKKKYGEMVKEARHDLRASIQLCATQCAQGRALKEWEMDAVVAYLWTRELNLGNLGIEGQQLSKLQQAAVSPEGRDSLKRWLEAQYVTASPATFADAPPDKAMGYSFEGRPEQGRAIYELGCRHCHRAGQVSGYILDYSRLTFRKLLRDMTEDDQESFYQSIRYGTSPVPGHRPYMPNYTLERMSHQQVEDLRAYVEQQAGLDG